MADIRQGLFDLLKGIIDDEWGPYDDEYYWAMVDAELPKLGLCEAVVGTTKVEQALDAPIGCNGQPGTLRDYLRILLLTLWEEQDGFSGKRPFGDSGWDNDIFEALVRAGVVDGELDEDGYLEDVDEDAANELVRAAIEAVFAP